MAKYDISVQLTGSDGNAFAVMGIAAKAMRRGGVEKAEIDKFYAEATSGDYDHLLQVCMEWVEVE